MGGFFNIYILFSVLHLPIWSSSSAPISQCVWDPKDHQHMMSLVEWHALRPYHCAILVFYLSFCLMLLRFPRVDLTVSPWLSYFSGGKSSLCTLYVLCLMNPWTPRSGYCKWPSFIHSTMSECLLAARHDSKCWPLPSGLGQCPHGAILSARTQYIE